MVVCQCCKGANVSKKTVRNIRDCPGGKTVCKADLYKCLGLPVPGVVDPECPYQTSTEYVEEPTQFNQANTECCCPCFAPEPRTFDLVSAGREAWLKKQRWQNFTIALIEQTEQEVDEIQQKIDLIRKERKLREKLWNKKAQLMKQEPVTLVSSSSDFSDAQSGCYCSK